MNEDLGLILVDHLISESDEPENPWTFVPDVIIWIQMGKWQMASHR
jgi:hypothetical protein